MANHMCVCVCVSVVSFVVYTMPGTIEIIRVSARTTFENSAAAELHSGFANRFAMHTLARPVEAHCIINWVVILQTRETSQVYHV